MTVDCYDNSGMDRCLSFQSITLGSGLFMLSNFRNMSTAIGCDTEVMAMKAEIGWQLTRIADGKHTSVVGIEIEWVVKNERRQQAKASTSAYTCGSNADCTHSNNVQGYLVKVSKGTTIFNKDAKINWLMLFGISVVNISADIDEYKDPERYQCQRHRKL
ncbi:uncharacterized protein [Populus alba]|uniref:uncharacterized protein isoform X2 n=1 Tax=Populus alba TaxID=43335 RepID=UPI001589914E|nr:uncharacterized protein LOC118059929 isoform X2 [Populus alba]